MQEEKLNMKQHRRHKELHDRYKLAMDNEFYLEAIMLVYNLMEDRLLSFLHYAGIVDKDSHKMTVYAKAKPGVRKVLALEPEKPFNLQNIERKVKLVQGFMKLEPEQETHMLAAIAERAKKRLDREEVIDTLNDCLEWKNKRNKYVHGYLKVYDQPDPEIMRKYVEDGMEIARKIDKYVRRFAPKKGTKGIREQFKLQSKSS